MTPPARTTAAPKATSSEQLDNLLARRILAGLFDYMILCVAMVSFFRPNEDATLLTPVALLNLLGLMYFGLQELTFGRTLGKLVAGIRVEAVHGRFSLRRRTLRYLLRIIDCLPVFYLVGLVFVLASPKGQRLGDMVAGTIIVRRREKQPVA